MHCVCLCACVINILFLRSMLLVSLLKHGSGAAKGEPWKQQQQQQQPWVIEIECASSFSSSPSYKVTMTISVDGLVNYSPTTNNWLGWVFISQLLPSLSTFTVTTVILWRHHTNCLLCSICQLTMMIKHPCNIAPSVINYILFYGWWCCIRTRIFTSGHWWLVVGCLQVAVAN